MANEIEVIEVAVPDVIEVVEIAIPGLQGPAGPTGPVGPGSVVTATAVVACGGHKVVRAVGGGVAPASSGDIAQAGTVLGLTVSAAVAGAAITVQAAGFVDEPSWSFVPGPVFLGLDGNITQTRPDVGFVQQVGVATAPTRLLVLLGLPIILA